MSRWWLLVLLGCERAAATSPSAAESADSTPAAVPWSLTIRGIYGRCPADGETCDQTYRVDAEGTLTTRVAPNPWNNPEAAARISRTKMSTADFAQVKALVHSKAFDEEMTSGFECQGHRRDPDATWTITFATSTSTRSQHGEYCMSGPSETTNTPRKVLDWLRK